MVTYFIENSNRRVLHLAQIYWNRRKRMINKPKVLRNHNTLFFCISIIILILAFPPGPVSADTPAEYPETTDSDMCLVCHSRPDPMVIFPSDETLSVQIDPEKYRSSVHADLECSACHPGLEVYPHPENSAQSLEEYRLSYHDSCKGCHSEQFNDVSMSIHEELFLKGVEGTPLCADCHQPHSQVKLCDPDEEATYEDRIWIADTCASCHEDLYETYHESIHGKGLIEDKNADMPTCIDCHNVHQICDPNDPSFRISSLDMCADCHTDPEIMDKYEQDVNVLNTYIVFHNTTVTMLERYDTEELTSKPTCYDCHGIHDVGDMSNPPTAVFDLAGAELYPPIKVEEKPAPARNVAATAALLGILVGGAGTMTVSQIIKESKKKNNNPE